MVEEDHEIKLGPIKLGVPMRDICLLTAIQGINSASEHRGVMWNDSCPGPSHCDPSCPLPGVLGCPLPCQLQVGATHEEDLMGSNSARTHAGCFSDDPQ